MGDEMFQRTENGVRVGERGEKSLGIEQRRRVEARRAADGQVMQQRVGLFLRVAHEGRAVEIRVEQGIGIETGRRALLDIMQERIALRRPHLAPVEQDVEQRVGTKARAPADQNIVQQRIVNIRDEVGVQRLVEIGVEQVGDGHGVRLHPVGHHRQPADFLGHGEGTPAAHGQIELPRSRPQALAVAGALAERVENQPPLVREHARQRDHLVLILRGGRRRRPGDVSARFSRRRLSPPRPGALRGFSRSGRPDRRL